jgi:hypothetical protein
MSIIDVMQQRGARLVTQTELARMRHEGGQAASRWSGETGAARIAAEIAAESQQREEERKARVAKMDAEDDRIRKEREAELERLRVDRVTTAEVELKATMRAAYLEQPGSTPQEFERDWPVLLKQHRLAQTLATAAAGDPKERLKQEFKALHRAPDFHVRPSPVEAIDVTDEV